MAQHPQRPPPATWMSCRVLFVVSIAKTTFNEVIDEAG
ncbi:MAG: hypothetical protein RL509_1968 [Pseudomonadota bacterium]|jgi:hypothetical protein